MPFEIQMEIDQDANKTAVARQSASPDHRNFPRLRQKIIGLIEKDVTESRANDSTEHQVQA